MARQVWIREGGDDQELVTVVSEEEGAVRVRTKDGFEREVDPDMIVEHLED